MKYFLNVCWSGVVLLKFWDVPLVSKSLFHPQCATGRTEAQASAIYDAGMGFIRQHLILSRWSVRRGVVNWQLKPKLHQYDHILYNCKLFRALASLFGRFLLCLTVWPWSNFQYVFFVQVFFLISFLKAHCKLTFWGTNPRYEHTFVDEDAMGWAKKLAVKFTRRRIIERSLVRSSRVRLLSLRWRAKALNASANKRALWKKITVIKRDWAWKRNDQSYFVTMSRTKVTLCPGCLGNR